MAWNEPGDGKDPWGRKDEQGPPDLDEIVQNFRKRLGGLFGGGGKGPAKKDGESNTTLVALAVAAAAIAWLVSGFYIVDEQERGVVLQFGEHVKTKGPGWGWVARGVQHVEKVNVSEVYKLSHQTRMLTADEAIVDVEVDVQYTKSDAEKYLFNIKDPDENLAEISESAIREIVGKNTLDYIVNIGRGNIALMTRELISTTLLDYDAGILVFQVNLPQVNFPGQVEDAVQDVNKAREDKERLKFEAEAYQNDIVPKARGEAARRLQDAMAYKLQVVENATGEASRFTKLLVEYKKAPEVTRERIYLEALESVLARSNKVLLDTEGSGNMMYLPIDKLIENSNRANFREGARAPVVSGSTGSLEGGPERSGDDYRSRTRGNR